MSVVYGTSTGLHGAIQFLVRDSQTSGDYFGFSLAAGDFRNNGVDGLAVGVTGHENLGSGSVEVFYGEPDIGFDTDDLQTQQLRHQTCPYNERWSCTTDRFGYSVAVGDFDGDGYDDLAAAAPFNDEYNPSPPHNVLVDTGSVHVFLYNPETDSFHETWEPVVRLSPLSPQADDNFGFSLAAGDFDGDGVDELAVGTPWCAIRAPNECGDDFPGAVYVYGPAVATPRRSRSRRAKGYEAYRGRSALTLRQTVIGGQAGDRFGAALAVGDFDDDGLDDLAVGAPYWEEGSRTDHGAVFTYSGQAQGTILRSGRRVDQGTDDIGDRREADDHFGASLAAGDVNLDGYDDLAIGVPNEDIERAGDPAIVNAGVIHLVYGSGGGLAPEGDPDNGIPASISQYAYKDRGTSQDPHHADDWFGFSLAIGSTGVDLPPVITLNGPAELTLECGVETYTEPGATATDDRDSSVDVEIGGDVVDTTACGIYTVVYTATDSAGNTSEATRTVTVVDTIQPAITLKGDADMVLECGVDTYTEPGATATDYCDTSPDVVIGGDVVDTTACETYTVVYTATDSSGNTSEATRTVTVVDTTPPTINGIVASPNVLWPPNHRMISIDLSVEATDLCDDDVDIVLASVVSSEPPDTGQGGDGHTAEDIQGAELGTEDYAISLRAERQGRGHGRIYTITYTATDDAGNSASGATEVVVPAKQGTGRGR